MRGERKIPAPFERDSQVSVKGRKGSKYSEKGERQRSLLMANQEFQRVQWRNLKLQASKGNGVRFGRVESSVKMRMTWEVWTSSADHGKWGVACAGSGPGKLEKGE